MISGQFWKAASVGRAPIGTLRRALRRLFEDEERLIVLFMVGLLALTVLVVLPWTLVDEVGPVAAVTVLGLMIGLYAYSIRREL